MKTLTKIWIAVAALVVVGLGGVVVVSATAEPEDPTTAEDLAINMGYSYVAEVCGANTVFLTYDGWERNPSEGQWTRYVDRDTGWLVGHVVFTHSGFSPIGAVTEEDKQEIRDATLGVVCADGVAKPIAEVESAL